MPSQSLISLNILLILIQKFKDMKKSICLFRKPLQNSPQPQVAINWREMIFEKIFEKNLLKNHLAALLLLALFALPMQAQILDFQNRLNVTLDDGTVVTLIGKAQKLSNDFTGEYYYLPCGLRLAARQDGTPEFLFLKYTTEEKADAGGVQGALMHFLMKWGLTPEQQKELQTKLEAKLKDIQQTSANSGFKGVKTPKVMGAVPLRANTEESFRITSGILTSKQFTPNFVTSGHAPIIEGEKIAVASILDKNGAQLLAATFEKNRSITDVSLTLKFDYEVLTPKVNGRITVDWSKVDHMYQNIKRDYTHHDKDDGTMPASNSLHDDIITDTEKDSLFQYMMETNIVKVDLDIAEVNNPIAQDVVKAFLDYFLSTISERQMVQSTAPKPIEQKDGERYQPSEDLYEYHMDRTKIETKVQNRHETYELNVRLPMVQTVTLTENLASWYDHVKHNPKCVSSVNLNDPFFQHRDIHMILDLEAEEMFGKEVNYVTINVRKKRKSGNDFTSAVTIDRSYLKDKGIRASLTYARGEDKESDVYDYKMQWSLRGGEIFPPNPEWVKGDWQGLTLATPIKPRMVMFEANLDELKELGIVRATAQIRYSKFGKEIESNIPITVSKGEPLAETMIFTDRNTQGYAWRLVLTHKEKGKMALDWDSKVNDDYVYATIPEELRNNDPSFMEKVLQQGKQILLPENEAEVQKGDQVLDRFKDVINILSDAKGGK